MENYFASTSRWMKHILLCSLFFITYNVSAQLDSVSVSASSSPGTDPSGLGMDGYIVTINVIVNDVSDLGEVAINIVSEEDEMLVANFKMDKAELISQNLLDGNQITSQLFVFESGEYKIETLVRNNKKANLPKVITIQNI